MVGNVEAVSLGGESPIVVEGESRLIGWKLIAQSRGVC